MWQNGKGKKKPAANQGEGGMQLFTILFSIFKMRLDEKQFFKFSATIHWVYLYFLTVCLLSFHP